MKTEREDQTRKQRIDPRLAAAGWHITQHDPVRALDRFDQSAIEEYPTTNGPADYALADGGQVLGVVEAKKVTLGPQGVLPQAERYSSGIASVVKHQGRFGVPVGREVLKRLMVELPPLEMQMAISSLGEAVDDARLSASAHLTSARAAIDRFRQAVLVAACSGRLTADWRERRSAPPETARTLIERSQAALQTFPKMRPNAEVWSEPDWLDLPSGWEWAPMRDLAHIRGGIQKQPKRTPRKNHHPYLRVANVLRGRLDLTDVQQFELIDGELAVFRLEPGDLLVVEGNGSSTEIGRAALWSGEIPDCVHQNHIIRVRCTQMNPRFLELFWNSPVGSREIASLAVTSAGLYSLSTKKIGAVPIPVAPPDEQEEVVRRASALLAAADKLQERVDRAAHSVDRTFQAVLAKAFRGELIPGGV